MQLPVAPRRALTRMLLSAAALWLAAAAAQAADVSPAQAAQRAVFQRAYATAAQQGGDAWRAQAQDLRGYILYPYLEAAALEHDLRQLSLAQVRDYQTRYPGSVPADQLRTHFLYELARRKDWIGFTALYPPGSGGDALKCDALQARLAAGGRLDFDADLAELWSKPSLPGACDPVLVAAHDQGLLTTPRLWARIDIAVKALHAGTVASMARWLPPADAADAQKLALAITDPAAAVAAAQGWSDTPRQRQAAALAVQRLARRQSTAADAAWQALQPRFAFSPTQRNDTLNALALFHAADYDPAALQRLINLPASAQSDATREWRVRVALAEENWPAVLSAINALAPAQQDDGEWRYFRARALDLIGDKAQARSRFQALAQEPNYFGFLAADQLGADYAICPQTPPSDAPLQRTLLATPGLQRAFELYAVNLPALARLEWNRVLAGGDAADRRAAAELAYQRGWYDRAIFTFSSGEALRYYAQRFPLATNDGLVTDARQAGIDPAWAYAILRAESAWMPDAHSGADARGLMQLLPGTGALVARQSGLPWNGADSLYDPRTNIMLGTRYLAQMSARFDGAPWLASAAYNAGPNKVDQWLAARGKLPPDIFTATIPYHETRDYVARVMAFSVIYDWRLDGSVVPLSARMPAVGLSYTLPTAGSLRRAVTCPSSRMPDSGSPATRMAQPPEDTRPVLPSAPASAATS